MPRTQRNHTSMNSASEYWIRVIPELSILLLVICVPTQMDLKLYYDSFKEMLCMPNLHRVTKKLVVLTLLKQLTRHSIPYIKINILISFSDGLGFLLLHCRGEPVSPWGDCLLVQVGWYCAYGCIFLNKWHNTHDSHGSAFIWLSWFQIRFGNAYLEPGPRSMEVDQNLQITIFYIIQKGFCL